MKELLGYMARHHEDLEKSFTDEQKETFEKFHVARRKQLSVIFAAVKLPKAMSWQSRESVGDRQRLWDGGESRSEYTSLAEAAIFEHTFKLGLRIAIETLQSENEN